MNLTEQDPSKSYFDELEADYFSPSPSLHSVGSDLTISPQLLHRSFSPLPEVSESGSDNFLSEELPWFPLPPANLQVHRTPLPEFDVELSHPAFSPLDHGITTCLNLAKKQLLEFSSSAFPALGSDDGLPYSAGTISPRSASSGFSSEDSSVHESYESYDEIQKIEHPRPRKAKTRNQGKRKRSKTTAFGAELDPSTVEAAIGKCEEKFDREHEKTMFFCNVPGCTVRLSTRFSLKRHMKRHTGERPFGCPLCDKAFAENSTLKRHMNVHKHEAGEEEIQRLIQKKSRKRRA